jgi:hypothetical protein
MEKRMVTGIADLENAYDGQGSGSRTDCRDGDGHANIGGHDLTEDGAIRQDAATSDDTSAGAAAMHDHEHRAGQMTKSDAGHHGILSGNDEGRGTETGNAGKRGDCSGMTPPKLETGVGYSGSGSEVGRNDRQNHELPVEALPGPVATVPTGQTG